MKKSKPIFSALSLIKIQIGLPKLFFVAPRVEQVKMDVNPVPTDNKVARDTSLVLTCDGILPNDVESIKLIYTLRPPVHAGKPSEPAKVSEEFCQIKKKYFTSNYILQFPLIGLYRLRPVFENYFLTVILTVRRSRKYGAHSECRKQ